MAKKTNTKTKGEELQAAIDKANKQFANEKMGLYAEPILGTDNAATIEITWGDWKHEHAYADYIMLQNDFVKIGEELTEEDGSDCYSSIHKYIYNRVLAFISRNSKTTKE